MAAFSFSSIKHHANLIKQIGEQQKIYKYMMFDNFEQSYKNNYLYFNRVDQYNDKRDSDQTDADKILHRKTFLKVLKYPLKIIMTL